MESAANKPVDPDREEGIKAIIFLQSMVGIVEPSDRAARSWDGFQKWERDATLRVFRSMKGES